MAAIATACTAGNPGPGRLDVGPSTTVDPIDGVVTVDTTEVFGVINPAIYGVVGLVEQPNEAGFRLSSWAGARAMRFNFLNGQIWNRGRDGEYRNTTDERADDVHELWLSDSKANRISTRMAVPSIGWVARNGDPEVCSYPSSDGTCGVPDADACATGDGPPARPTNAHQEVTSKAVADWVRRTVRDRLGIDFVAVTDAPERWGVDHYDIHPTCSTYQEIFETYLEYATVIRKTAPAARLAGPSMCCWFEDTDPPPAPDGSTDGLLHWFLSELKKRDAVAEEILRGAPTTTVEGDEQPATTVAPSGANPPTTIIDVVDVQFRPRSPVMPEDVPPGADPAEIDALRVRATRELWDSRFVPEGSIEPVAFLPTMRSTIDAYYPKMPLIISDWTFGGDDRMSGAIAIAETLGRFTQAEVLAAAYARQPQPGEPAFYAFKLFGNYDSRGSRFVGTAIGATHNVEDLSTFAALDDTGVLRIAFVNHSPDESADVELDFGGVQPTRAGELWSYRPTSPDRILFERVPTRTVLEASVSIAPNSISMFEVDVRERDPNTTG